MIAEHAVRAVISIEGLELARELEQYVEQVVVDDHLKLPDSFAITLLDPEHDMLARAGLRVGAKVQISGNARGNQEDKPLIHGEVTAIEADYGVFGARVMVRGYDMSHRLQRGSRTETYQNVTDSDIARQVARRAGIEVGAIEDTTETFDHIAQANLSDWDFLKGRAQAIGFELVVLDGKLHFRQARESAEAPAEGSLLLNSARQLVFGDGLVEYHQHISSAAQVSEVEVRGWDPEQKQSVTVTVSAGTTAAQLDSASPSSLAQTFGAPRFVSVAEPYTRTAEAEKAAAAIAESIGSAFAEAEGIARGDPELRAGAAVSVAGVADEFAGRYVLTHTRHVFDKDGYRTHFSISGRHDRSLLGLVAQAGPGPGASSGHAGSTSVAGLVRGIVTANDDPQALGRVKVKMPALDDRFESTWAPVLQPGAGPSSGAVFLPEVNDEVLVGFEHGNFDYPVVVGSLYNGVDKPALGEGLFDNGKVRRRGVVSRLNHRLIFFDDPQKSGIALLTDGDTQKVSLNKTGSELRLYSDKKLTIESGNELYLKARQIKLEADSSFEIRAARITIKADGVIDVDGAQITLN